MDISLIHGFKRLMRHEVNKGERVHTHSLLKTPPFYKERIMKKVYTRISDEERIELYALRKEGLSMIEISKILGRHRSSLYKELKRNTGGKGYRPKQAHELSQMRAKRDVPFKWNEEIESYTRKALELDYSPAQISETMNLDGITAVSHERIYQFIYEDVKNGGDLYKHLRVRGTKKQKKRYGKNDYRGQIPNRVDIAERPKSIEDRNRIGDWEADLVSGAHHKGFLVTLVDRKSRYALIGHVLNKTSELVTSEIIRLLAQSHLPVKTITYDNGREFNGHESVAKAFDCKTYFAKPYHSWERGTNENTNGLIRQYFPKGIDLRNVLEFDLQHAMNRINNRPKKILGFKSPKMVAYRTPRVALAS